MATQTLTQISCAHFSFSLSFFSHLVCEQKKPTPPVTEMRHALLKKREVSVKGEREIVGREKCWTQLIYDLVCLHIYQSTQPLPQSCFKDAQVIYLRR